MKRLRRTLLEIWFILPLAGVVGFLGPFGTYLLGDFFTRSIRWAIVLSCAYVVVRPTLFFWGWIARVTRLPRRSVLIWGLLAASVPLGLPWQIWRPDEIRALGGYAGVIPFSVLSSLTVLLIAWLAERTDETLLQTYGGPVQRLRSTTEGQPAVAEAVLPVIRPPVALPPTRNGNLPRLYARLGPTFDGPILALESEDHYVRVHGPKGTTLILMRLRDAIAEMDEADGAQTHRSWWIAQEGIADVIRTGRTMDIMLTSGTRAPIARDSVERLERSGFLPGAQGNEG